MTRGLIEEVGRKEALGRPILYGTTDAFLRHFCISSLSDLPEIDFSALAAKLSASGTQAAESSDGEALLSDAENDLNSAGAENARPDGHEPLADATTSDEPGVAQTPKDEMQM